MLAIGVHHQRVGEALQLRPLRAGEHGRPFAGVARLDEHLQRRIRARQVGEHLFAAVGAAVDHHQDRPPLPEHLRHHFA